jgi:hypothetical protein
MSKAEQNNIVAKWEWPLNLAISNLLLCLTILRKASLRIIKSGVIIGKSQ